MRTTSISAIEDGPILRTNLTTLLVCCVLLLLIPEVSQAGPKISVFTGGERDSDACGAIGRIVGLNPRGDNFLAVRSGPGLHFPVVDRLESHSRVILCDRQGSWIGVVYSRMNQDCGTGSPRAKRSPYDGPCRSGWIYDKFVALEAG